MCSRRSLLLLAAIPIISTPVVLSQHPHGHHFHHGGQPALFRTADACVACHNGLTTPAGEDVSIGSRWRASMMANASRDPYWQAGVRRELLDHPGAADVIEDECSICHMPMTTFPARAGGSRGTIFRYLPVREEGGPDAALAADGTSCAVCHQIEPTGLGGSASFTGHYQIGLAPPRRAYGPYVVHGGSAHLMRSASGYVPLESAHVQQSELCATCHTLFTHALGPSGESLSELPEQVPYLEWRHSAYATTRSCQSCHMPEVADTTPISSVMGQERPGLSRHDFHGGNFFMPRVLLRYAADLGVAALPSELDAASRETVARLQTETATLTIANLERSAGRLAAEVRIENLAGHKLPTGYPSRRAWLHVMVRDRAGSIVFESGGFDGGRVTGNENDEDGTRWEPHYREIDSPAQVQVYETVMVDAAGMPTTGLLTGVRYAKDNRLLPRGFDKASAHAHVAVHGQAAGDADFAAGGDTVRYRVSVVEAAGPFTVDAQLWYQPIGWRWAQNLRQRPAFETDRFVAYYEATAPASAVVLAKATKQVH